MFTKISHTAVSSMLIFSLTLGVAFEPKNSYASKADYNRVCKSGDEKKSEDVVKTCAEAKVAKNTRDLEATKLAIYTAATAIAVTFAVASKIPFAQAAITACIALGIAVPAATMVADLGVAAKNGSIVNAAMGSMTSVTTLVTNSMHAKEGIQAAKSLGKFSAKDAANGAGKAERKEACEPVAISFGVSTAMSALGLGIAQMTFDKTSKLAATYKDNPANQANLLENNYQYKTGEVAIGSQNTSSMGGGPQIDAMTVEACDSKSGSEYLKCMGKFDSDLAKMSASPQFLDSMSKFLGQDVGNFAKNAPRESGAMGAYVANAMGLGAGAAEGLNKIPKNFEELAKDAGLMKFESPTFANSKKSGLDTATPDFNKLMADMLKQLNPNASTEKKDEDAAELAFRQMELLPADKLMQNKDISLFARVGFRYRKSSPKVENLNWALPQNQQPSSDGTSRSPARN